MIGKCLRSTLDAVRDRVPVKAGDRAGGVADADVQMVARVTRFHRCAVPVGGHLHVADPVNAVVLPTAVLGRAAVGLAFDEIAEDSVVRCRAEVVGDLFVHQEGAVPLQLHPDLIVGDVLTRALRACRRRQRDEGARAGAQCHQRNRNEPHVLHSSEMPHPSDMPPHCSDTPHCSDMIASYSAAGSRCGLPETSTTTRAISKFARNGAS
jgi:hypothetical protein